jgi:hypothetical protein
MHIVHQNTSHRDYCELKPVSLESKHACIIYRASNSDERMLHRIQNQSHLFGPFRQVSVINKSRGVPIEKILV